MKRIRYTGDKVGSFSIHNFRWGNNGQDRENDVPDEEAAFLMEQADFEPAVEPDDPRAAQVGNNRLYHWGVGYPICEYKIQSESATAISAIEALTTGRRVNCNALTANFERAHYAAWLIQDGLVQSRTFGEMELFTTWEGMLLKIIAHHKNYFLAIEMLHCVADELRKYFLELGLLETPRPILPPAPLNGARAVEGAVSTKVADDMEEDERIGQARKAFEDAKQRVEEARLKIELATIDMAERPERYKRPHLQELDLQLIAAKEGELEAKREYLELEDASRMGTGEQPQVTVARREHRKAMYEVEKKRLEIERLKVSARDIPGQFVDGGLRELERELIAAQGTALEAQGQLPELDEAAGSKAINPEALKHASAMHRPSRFFITHSFKDIEFARQLCNDLHAAKLDGFFDKYSIKPGDILASEISQGLEACDIYLPVLSFAALESRWCKEEINAALTLSNSPNRNGRPRIIPILLEDCQDEMPIFLQSRLYIKFAGRYPDALKDLLLNGFGQATPPPMT